MVVFDQRDDFLFQFFIFQQHDVTFEDRCFLFTKRFTGFNSDGFELRGGLAASVEETLHFLIHLLCSDLFPVDDDFIFFQQKCFAKSDTR